MLRQFYQTLVDQGLAGEPADRAQAQVILTDPSVELLPLLDAAYQVRRKFMGNSVRIHVLNNAQNGHCPEDCHYCAQAKSSQADIEEYPLKSDEEILAEAKDAYDSGAYRYCMVFAGRGPSQSRVEHLARLIREIKSRYPIQVCVSAGLLDSPKARLLKEAGLDRLNHNLNTSANNYPKICTTHTYADRLNTMSAARENGLELCSGIIVGMGETPLDVIEVAGTLRQYRVSSIPVNFFLPIPGTALPDAPPLTPEYCLRVLCLFRLMNPDAEIRAAAGREYHLRQMEVLALYPANSIFLDGYLNARGESRSRTLKMIQDAGFTIESEIPLADLIKQEHADGACAPTCFTPPVLKARVELRRHKD